jgi:glycosyltransferase involved in cell wall biosynthesis
LLWISIFARVITGCRLIYDVQENYFFNILYTNSFRPVAKVFIAAYVRFTEVLTSPFINHFFLAEAEYEKELPFLGSRKTRILNKVKKPENIVARERTSGKRSLLFSGTLAESTGVFTAIELAVKLHDVDPNMTLDIVGFCPQQETLFKIINTIEPYPFIQLTGGQKLVEHSLIIKYIQQADFGIIAYPHNKSTRSSIPTKLYEYLGHQLPIMLIDHSPWVDLCSPFQAAVVFDPRHIQASQMLDSINTQKFYSRIPDDVYWISEERKLLNVVSELV